MDKVDERDKSILKHKNQFTMLNSLWFAVGSLMQQVSDIRNTVRPGIQSKLRYCELQGSDVIPRAAATRIVAVIWYE